MEATSKELYEGISLSARDDLAQLRQTQRGRLGSLEVINELGLESIPNGQKFVF